MRVTNAGLVLSGPYLSPLFARLRLLGADGRFRSREAAGRGVHFLQYLVHGRLDAREPSLALNKLFCGLRSEAPVPARIETDAEERATCDALLAAILASWPTMRGSSIAALRETYLQREGELTEAEGNLRLEVPRKTFDVLLDALPWSLHTVLHPWMTAPLNVSW